MNEHAVKWIFVKIINGQTVCTLFLGKRLTLTGLLFFCHTPTATVIFKIYIQFSTKKTAVISAIEDLEIFIIMPLSQEALTKFLSLIMAETPCNCLKCSFTNSQFIIED